MADVVVTGDGGSGAGAGLIVGVLIVILAIGFAIWYFGFNPANNKSGTDINVQPPQINVNVPSAPAKPASS
jgi:hypothetical protein